jgi:hypothetical protein
LKEQRRGDHYQSSQPEISAPQQRILRVKQRTYPYKRVHVRPISMEMGENNAIERPDAKAKIKTPIEPACGKRNPSRFEPAESAAIIPAGQPLTNEREAERHPYECIICYSIAAQRIGPYLKNK